jgi:putative transposase
MGGSGKMAGMARSARVAPGGMLFHVLNRGIDADCWMPNPWRFLLWPQHDGDLSRFIERMTNMHTQRRQLAKLRAGHGHRCQGRFQSFSVESDDHFRRMARYVERNAMRAGLA